MKTPAEQASTSGIQKTLACQEEVLAISLQSYGEAHPRCSGELQQFRACVTACIFDLVSRKA
jgi:hypothetical protein